MKGGKKRRNCVLEFYGFKLNRLLVKEMLISCLFSAQQYKMDIIGTYALIIGAEKDNS